MAPATTSALPLKLPPESPWVESYRLARDTVEEFRALSAHHGGLVRQADAARMLGLSLSRVEQLVRDGRFEEVDVVSATGELVFQGVGLESVLAWRRTARTGRPKKRLD